MKLLNVIAVLEMLRTYLELIELGTFEERFEYLKLSANVGDTTFGWKRYLNQKFYKSNEWRSFRNSVIVRDCGMDLGVSDRLITGPIIIHHINPITYEDVLLRNPCLFDMNNVICVSDATHKAIHYGDIERLPGVPIERAPNDTCPWHH